ncbi:COX15/CtaA family protein [Gammaproteobacteria bacterium AH-315-E17]|nr:COX15/CtaA family protein [Gammaproteobacteria bacterium AH-315-E17]
MKGHKPTYYLTLGATLLAACVVVLGAFTRLSDAGLGCPDWPGCYGFMWMPETVDEIVQAEELFPHATFEAEKAWPEMVHRYFASTLGFVIILINFFNWKYRTRLNQPIKLPAFLLVLVIVQGLFGMWTVTLNLWPQVVTLHLLGGFMTLSLLWLLSLRLDNRPWPQPTIPIRHWLILKPLAKIAMVLLVLQIALGGWLSSNYAALACPDFPTCQNQLVPTMDFGNGFNIFQDIGPNYLGGKMDGEARVAIHFTHRVGAIIVTFFILFLIMQLYRNHGNTPLKGLTHTISVLLLVQVGLGISNVIGSLPLWVAVAHNAFGALLLLSLVTLNYRLHKSTATMV